MGWARAKFFSRRLNMLEYLTPIQEAFMIFVELKKEQLNFLELQLTAVCGMTEKNSKFISDLLDTYQSTVLPASKKVSTESFEEKARKQLAEEVKKAFIIKQTDALDSDKIKRNPNAASLASRYYMDQEQNKVVRKSKVKSTKNSIKEER